MFNRRFGEEAEVAGVVAGGEKALRDEELLECSDIAATTAAREIAGEIGAHCGGVEDASLLEGLEFCEGGLELCLEFLNGGGRGQKRANEYDKPERKKNFLHVPTLSHAAAPRGRPRGDNILR